MVYSFKCQECGLTKDIEKPMNDPFPEVMCDTCNHEMSRDYVGESSSRRTIIPEYMTGPYQVKNESSFKYDQSPSNRKHIYGGYSGKEKK